MLADAEQKVSEFSHVTSKTNSLCFISCPLMILDRQIRWDYIVFIGIAFSLYVNTLWHQFVLDDEVVITENRFVRQGIDGIGSIFSHDTFAGYKRVSEDTQIVTGGRYRPMSLVFFALLYSLFGANPFVFHLFSVVLYVASALVLFHLINLWLQDRAYGKIIAGAATLIFIVHPVHTEVVANVKGCDEQLALLFGMVSCICFLKAWDEKKIQWSLLAAILLLIACLAKENAIVWTVIMPLSLFFFRQSDLNEILKKSIPVFLAAIVFVLIRQSVIGGDHDVSLAADPLNDPFLLWNGNNWVPVTAMEKAATILYAFGNQVRLLLFPYPLTHDYYPNHIPIQDFSCHFVWISLVLLIGIVALILTGFKRKGIIAFGLLFFLISISITSNVFFPVGTFMAERFLYLPSLGIALAIVVYPVHLYKERQMKFLAPLLGLIVIIFSWLTITRNAAWKNNETLLRKDATVSSRSLKLRNDLGTLLLTKSLQSADQAEREKLLNEAATHLKFAIDNHPTYYDAYLAYGANAFYLKEYDESVKAYRRAYVLNPHDAMAKTGLLYALQGNGINLGQTGHPDQAIIPLTEAWLLQPDTTSAIELSNYYFILNKDEEAVQWLEKAVELAPENADLKQRLLRARSRRK